VIICSIEDQRDRATKAGVAGYLVKPIVEDDLLRAVEEAIASAPGRTIKALVADADAGRTETIRQVLESAGHTVQSVTSGIDALQLIMGGKADVVILDLELPDMDGYGLLTSIRSQPDNQQMPAILVGDRTLSKDELSRVDVNLTRVLSRDRLTHDSLLAAVGELIENLQMTT
jgi:two-component system chemotaxis sensor kinase CheA